MYLRTKGPQVLFISYSTCRVGYSVIYSLRPHAVNYVSKATGLLRGQVGYHSCRAVINNGGNWRMTTKNVNAHSRRQEDAWEHSKRERPLKFDSESPIDIASGLEKEGKYDDAITVLERFVKERPKNGPGWMRLAQILAKRKHKVDQAVEVFKQALSLNPRNALLWQGWADLEKSRRRFNEARELFKRVLQVREDFPSAYHSWGLMEYHLGNIETALNLLLKGLEHNPSNRYLLHALGVLYDKQGNTEEARTILLRGKELFPDNAQFCHALGVLEFKAGNIELSREYFSLAVKLDSRHTLSWLTWGQLEELEGNLDKARECYRTATKIDPRGAVQLWQAWARLEENSHNIEVALALYEEATKYHPYDGELWCAWGKLLVDQVDYISAREKFQQGVILQPNVSYAYQCWAQLEANLGNIEEARRIYMVGARKSKGNEHYTALLHSWALFEWKQGDKERARKLLTFAVDIDDQHGWLWRTFARLEADCGNLESARHYFARAVNAKPYEALTWKYWSQVEEMFGQHDRAVAYQKRAEELASINKLSLMDPEKPLARPLERHLG
eukprot:jgi/Galph1/560/GphlegSOOS_G5374.1